MIAQPTSSASPSSPSSVEQEVLLLRTQLDDALGRIHKLEVQVEGKPVAGVEPVVHRPLLPLDSPAMREALELCAEVFPSCRTKLEVLTDPDDPDRTWRLITVYWKSSVREAIDQQSVWHNRFDALHPEAIHDIGLFVVPE